MDAHDKARAQAAKMLKATIKDKPMPALAVVLVPGDDGGCHVASNFALPSKDVGRLVSMAVNEAVTDFLTRYASKRPTGKVGTTIMAPSPKTVN